MLDIRDDKSLWERKNLDGVGKVLLVEESYYDEIANIFDKQQREIQWLYGKLNQINDIIEKGRGESK